MYGIKRKPQNQFHGFRYSDDVMVTRPAGKPCPRCLGQMFSETDYYGQYWNCLQCGHQDDGKWNPEVKIGRTGQLCPGGRP
jgi:hypothetical protein